MTSSIFNQTAPGVIRGMPPSGATCKLPDGRRVTLAQLAEIVKGKTPEQACKELGVDYSRLRNIMGMFGL